MRGGYVEIRRWERREVKRDEIRRKKKASNPSPLSSPIQDMMMEDLALADGNDEEEDVIDSEDIALDLELQEALEGSR